MTRIRVEPHGGSWIVTLQMPDGGWWRLGTEFTTMESALREAEKRARLARRSGHRVEVWTPGQ